jgi:hypothetical protein
MPGAKKKPETIGGLAAALAEVKAQVATQRRIIDLLVYQGHEQGDLIARQGRRIAELQRIADEVVQPVVTGTIAQLVTAMQGQTDLTRLIVRVAGHHKEAIDAAFEQIGALEERCFDRGDDDDDDDDDGDDDGDPPITFGPSRN